MAVSFGSQRDIPERDASRAEKLFAELDNRRISDDSGVWVFEVFGIHAVANDLWIQVAPAQNAAAGLVLHFSAAATAGQALAALAAWSKIPADDRPRIVEVSDFDELPSEDAPAPPRVLAK